MGIYNQVLNFVKCMWCTEKIKIMSKILLTKILIKMLIGMKKYALILKRSLFTLFNKKSKTNA